LPFLYAATALGVAFTGAGAYSLDALVGLKFLSEPLIIGGILVMAVVGAAVTLGLRRQAQRASSDSTELNVIGVIITSDKIAPAV
jgi:hypothetical protein